LIYLLKNHKNLSLLLKLEKKIEVVKDVLFPVKHYMESFKSQLKQDFMCLLVNDSIVWASPDWLGINQIDRLLFVLIGRIYSSNDMNEIPIYFSKTSLENEATGNVRFYLTSRFPSN